MMMEFVNFFEDYEWVYMDVYKIKIRKTEKTPLYRAIELGNMAIVVMLLMNNKIDVNKKNKFDFYISRYGGSGRFALKLELTPLNRAIESENIEIVKLLLINNSIDVILNSSIH